MSKQVTKQTLLERAETLITGRGKKFTDKRSKVLAVLMQEQKPMSAYELTDAYNVMYGEHIIAPSVYRILDWLVESHIAHRLMSINKFVACCSHQCVSQSNFSMFFICIRCQKTEESHASDCLKQEIYQDLSSSQFANVMPHIELTGLCTQCQKLSTAEVIND